MYKFISAIQGRNFVSEYRDGNQIGVLVGNQKGKWMAFAATANGLIQVGAFHKSKHAAVAVLLRAC